jgi:two-component system, cell cycle sensor histidine kinase and response regulator CckA
MAKPPGTGNPVSESGLRTSGKRFRTLIEKAPIAIGMARSGVTLYANPKYLEMFGLRSLEEVQGHPVAEQCAPESRADVEERARQRAAGLPGPTDYEAIGLRKDGSRFPVHAMVTMVELDDGPCTLAFLTDISERQQAIAALRGSEERFRNLIERAPIAIGLARQGVTLYANPKYLEVFGFESVDEVRGRSIGEQFPPDIRAEVVARARARAQGLSAPSEYESIGQRKDGSQFPIHVAAAMVQLPDGPCTAGFITDITEQKRAEDELARSELYYRSLIENAADVISVLGSEGQLRYLSQSVERVLGYKPEEIQGRSVFDLIHPEDLDLAKGRLKESLETGARFEHFEIRVRHRDGSWRTLSVTGTLLPSETGLRGVVTSARDLTEQRQLEAQFRQAQKMEAVGRLAGGVAHDFNNLLTVIHGYGDMLRSSLPEGSSNAVSVEEILAAAERATTLTRQLLAFSRRQVLEPRTIRLDAAVFEIEKMLRRLIGEDVELLLACEKAPGCVKADPGQIEQILMNLSVNARDAMPNGGRLTIGIADAEIDETHAARPGQPSPGPYVKLVISDTGVGMSAETLSHLFEPFFTTKSPGKGTGLGLATVYGIVKQSGGYIWASSVEGSGTTFQIFLPRVDGEPSAVTPTRTSSAPGGDETILVVEDEEAVRKLTVSVLSSRGYAILEASGPAEGVDLAARHPGRIDLLVTDVVMPVMSGSELAGMLVARRPSMKVLFMSGYVDDTIGNHGVLKAGVRLIRKPFAPASLAREVRDVLDRPTIEGSTPPSHEGPPRR